MAEKSSEFFELVRFIEPEPGEDLRSKSSRSEKFHAVKFEDERKFSRISSNYDSLPRSVILFSAFEESDAVKFEDEKKFIGISSSW